tara:strand:+ start:663 stop:2798 length:2136 start_codon:yes stop_codon:yes gene_type:complete
MALYGSENEEEINVAPAMDEEEFKAQCRSEIDDAVDFCENYLGPKRSSATEAYYQRQYGDEEQGRSQFIDSTIRDTVHAILPSLLKIFFSSDKVMEFVPRMPEDVPFADQASDYVSWVISQNNPGFMVYHDAMKDALIRGSGFIKFYYSEHKEVEGYTYTGLDDDTLAFLMQDEGVEIKEIDSKPIEEVPGVPPEEVPMTHDVRIVKTSDKGKICIECVPPEEIIYNRRSTGFENNSTTLIGHRRVMTVGELVSYGYDKEDFIHLAGTKYDLDDSEEFITRRPEVHGSDGGNVINDDASKRLLYTEIYIKVDYDQDDIAEIRRVCFCGDNQEVMLMNEPVNDFPFVHLNPYPEPHDSTGSGIHDRLKDVQRTKTSIIRAMLDSLSLSVFPRTAFVDGEVSVSDLMNGEIGSLVRMRSPNSIVPLHLPYTGQQAEGMLNYFGEVTENRTGISKASLGLDPSSLMSSSPIAVNGTLSNAQQKVEYVARVFAEKAFKPLYKGILKLIVQHQDQETVIRLRNDWVPMDPKAWDSNMDVMVNVALGGGDDNLRLQALQMIASKQEQILTTVGPDNPLVGVVEYANTLRKITELSGFKDADQFFKDPLKQPPPEPKEKEPTPEEQMMAMQQQQFAMTMELEKAKLQLDAEKAKTNAQIKEAEMTVDAQLKITELGAKYNQSIDTTQLKGDLDTQREKIRSSANIESARIHAENRGNR